MSSFFMLLIQRYSFTIQRQYLILRNVNPNHFPHTVVYILGHIFWTVWLENPQPLLLPKFIEDRCNGNDFESEN